jgi:hypothetical protein
VNVLLNTFQRFVYFGIVALILSQSSLHSQPDSSLVYPGTDGKLVYAGYANDGQASTGNLMIDFSYAGYMGGGVSIPWVPVVFELEPDPTVEDDHARIQDAIDEMTTMGFASESSPGALLLRAGTYTVSKTLRITNSGIVIRGEGQHAGGTLIRFTTIVQDNLLEFEGSDDWEMNGTAVSITDTLVPSGTRSFNVASTANFAVNDRIIVNRTPNQAWIDLLEMGQYGWTPEGYESQSPRTITSIDTDTNTITLNEPLVHAIESRYGGGEVYKYTFDSIKQVGIERLRLESSYVGEDDENHGWNAIVFEKVENSWARQITAKYFGYSCVNVRNNSQYVTVEDCAQLDPISQLSGSRRYSFNLDNSTFVLFQRCYAKKGRHDFVTGSRFAGPNAFVDCLAEVADTDIGPHQRYAEGLLFDNIKGREIHVQNRTDSGSGHGWAGTQTVFWNCNADSFICESPEAAMNFAIGCVGEFFDGSRIDEPDGFIESSQAHVTPRSLYYKQLEDRLGNSALLNVILNDQTSGTIWINLANWQSDPETLTASLGTPLGLNAVVDYLLPAPPNLLEADTGWTVVSGPGNVTFEDSSAATTSAQFSQAGTYTLKYTLIEKDNLNSALTYNGSEIFNVYVPSGNLTLNPADFSSIGTITSGMTTLSFDTDSLEVSGDVTGNGVHYQDEYGSTLAVFTFDTINLTSTPAITGSYPIVIMSHDDITIDTIINVNGGDGANQGQGIGIAGGENGGDAYRRFAPSNPPDGQGLGGSPCISRGADITTVGSSFNSFASGGGGFGGNGGDSDGPGGVSYGDKRLSSLLTGSGAGGSFTKGGGAGGGGIGIIAENDLTIMTSAEINARGGKGNDSNSNATSGGGSGGAILLGARNVNLMGALDVSGGDGGADTNSGNGTQSIGGGGGGGRIAVYYCDTLTRNNDTIIVAGGQPSGLNPIGQAGSNGTEYFGSDSIGLAEKWFFAERGIINPSSTDWLTDYDDDGLSAWLEYAIGGSTSTQDRSLLPTLTPDGSGNYKFTFNRSQNGINSNAYVVETSTTLQPNGWTELSYSNGTLTAHPTITDFDQIAVSIPTSEDKFFIRLRIR